LVPNPAELNPWRYNTTYLLLIIFALSKFLGLSRSKFAMKDI
jgi:hypothetical protein